jgi:hypothetical protein
VVVNLHTGASQVIEHAPAGPQVLPLALSPDGRTLAVAPTNANARSVPGTRPLLLLPTGAGTGFATARSVTAPACGRMSGELGQPRWTSRGLYAYRTCDAAGARTGQAIAKVDTAAGTATVLHGLAAAQTLQLAAFEGPSGPLFVTADTSLPATPKIRVLDPSHGWSGRTVTGIDALTAISAE